VTMATILLLLLGLLVGLPLLRAHGVTGSAAPTPPPLPVLPVPSYAQLQWQLSEMALFLHFGPNTFTDSEWGSRRARRRYRAGAVPLAVGPARAGVRRHRRVQRALLGPDDGIAHQVCQRLRSNCEIIVVFVNGDLAGRLLNFGFRLRRASIQMWLCACGNIN
jgi:hypothetical protein